MMGCDDSSEDGSRLSLDGSDGSSDDEFGCGVEMLVQFGCWFSWAMVQFGCGVEMMGQMRAQMV